MEEGSEPVEFFRVDLVLKIKLIVKRNFCTATCVFIGPINLFISFSFFVHPF